MFETYSIIAIVGLPMMMAYLIVIVRILERKFLPSSNDKYAIHPTFQIPVLRDAALITLAIDFSELFQVIQPQIYIDGPYQRYQFVLIMVLIIFHLSSLIMSIYSTRFVEMRKEKYQGGWWKLMNAYIALAVLLTNAITIQHVLGLVGGAR